MKIVLLEEQEGQTHNEREFTSEVVKVGRDPLECHIVFDQSEWPTVSRRHAQFRQREGSFLLVDTKSKFGTFVDDARVSDPVEVRVGSRVQFGKGGPLLRIIAIEQTPVDEPSPAPGTTFRQQATVRDAPETPKKNPR